MTGMFYTAEAFNVDLSQWDVSSVTNMNGMFFEARSFKQKVCGDTWVYSKASQIGMFAGSSGSIFPRLCKSGPTPATTPVKYHFITRIPLSERELIARTPISTSVSTSAFTSTMLSTMACPKCGTFAKSGRASCCAPGGAWYNNCGGAANKNVDHRWSEGVEACTRKSEAYDM